MKSKVSSIAAYLETIPEERKAAFAKLRSTINKNLPKGFEEVLSYGMIGYVVPQKLYPEGYHCNPELPLPFINIASQKNFIAIYHMGLYSSPELLNWFTKEYTATCKSKPDMGKSCLRLKKIDAIPFDLIADLCKKMNPKDWIALYEKKYKK